MESIVQSFPAIVLAGERQDELSTKPGIFTKVLGKPAIERVIETLNKSDCSDHIYLVGPSPKTDTALRILENLLSLPTVSYVEPAEGPSKSAKLAFEVIGKTALLTTGDHALLTPKIVNDFCEEANKKTSDFIVGLVPYKNVKALYPGSRRTLLKFHDNILCGSNLFFLKTQKSKNVLNLWAKIEDNRKAPWKLVMQFGVKILLKYLVGRLQSKEAFDYLSDRTNSNIDYILIDDARAAIDVDSPQDLILAEKILEEKESKNV